jgi:hypothetical protein
VTCADTATLRAGAGWSAKRLAARMVAVHAARVGRGVGGGHAGGERLARLMAALRAALFAASVVDGAPRLAVDADAVAGEAAARDLADTTLLAEVTRALRAGRESGAETPRGLAERFGAAVERALAAGLAPDGADPEAATVSSSASRPSAGRALG